MTRTCLRRSDSSTAAIWLGSWREGEGEGEGKGKDKGEGIYLTWCKTKVEAGWQSDGA